VLNLKTLLEELIHDVKFEDQVGKLEKNGNHSNFAPPIFGGKIITQKSVAIW
jgi:hypothetical protein